VPLIDVVLLIVAVKLYTHVAGTGAVGVMVSVTADPLRVHTSAPLLLSAVFG